MDDRAFILANLHLHAVLPRLEELVKLDEEARSIAQEKVGKVWNGNPEISGGLLAPLL